MMLLFHRPKNFKVSLWTRYFPVNPSSCVSSTHKLAFPMHCSCLTSNQRFRGRSPHSMLASLGTISFKRVISKDGTHYLFGKDIMRHQNARSLQRSLQRQLHILRPIERYRIIRAPAYISPDTCERWLRHTRPAAPLSNPLTPHRS